MMKKRRTKKDELLDVAKKMPPLHHGMQGKDFDWDKSETMKWLLEQEEILNFIWQSICNRGEASRLVKYDRGTGTWQGVDYDGEN